ncbi:MAG TPA: MaoC/PaaZ C-terminal domain-containing protein [Acidimicrobiia bacterium]|nr:MaoC/PaaZ C-terminal domain-containing protein [Acidimicrobiia bacterium]
MIETLTGKKYGPFPIRVCREKVAEFVMATGDDPNRWTDNAPPGWAASALFAVAPFLLSDRALANRSVIHGEQRFRWSGPIVVEEEIVVSGSVSRIRERGGVWFANFDLEAGPVSGTSTFLISGEGPARGEVAEHPERGPEQKEDGEFSASRSDLIRYAAATKDWNAIHWDHRSAVKAGLNGIVVHGLLQAAWIMRSVSKEQTPAEARFRFRSPLLVGESAQLSLVEQGEVVTARLSRGNEELVAASLTLVSHQTH